VKHPLETVRPFQFASVVLAEQGLDPQDSEGVQEFLERHVEAMIEQALRERSPKAPDLPLIRLRVGPAWVGLRRRRQHVLSSGAAAARLSSCLGPWYLALLHTCIPRRCAPPPPPTPH
jgi:hypothetical protein